MIGPCARALCAPLLALSSAYLAVPAPDDPAGARPAAGVGQEPPRSDAAPDLRIVRVDEVWGEDPHSAFTDLLRDGDALLLAFRVGRGHVSSDGALQVLRSTNAIDWMAAARLSLDGYDLRDADLSRAPDGRLLLLGGAAPRPADGERAPTGTAAAWSEDGRAWSSPRLVVEPGRWLWRVTWVGERAFGVSYSAGSGADRLDLLTSVDGETWEVRAADLHPGVPSNETALAFVPAEDGGEPRCVALTRGARGETASVGIADAPYESFRWRRLDANVGGPNLTRAPDGRWIAGGRLSDDGGARTAVFFLDPETGERSAPLVLPSGGDTSYPGFAWWEGELLVSYYSSHDDEAPGGRKSRIYVARLALDARGTEDE